MRYVASLTDYFRNRAWGMNLLQESVCVLIPIVGPMILSGRHLRAFDWSPQPRVDGADEEAAFDFAKFSPYLEAGLQPFLVSLLLALALFPLTLLAFAPLLLIPLFELQPPAALVVLALCAVLWVFTWVVYGVASAPVIIGAGLTGRLAGGFSLTFIRAFLARVGGATLIAMLFLYTVGTVLMALGYLALCLGIYPASAVWTYMHWHLCHQLYRRYLDKGGEPLPVAPSVSGAAREAPPCPVHS